MTNSFPTRPSRLTTNYRWRFFSARQALTTLVCVQLLGSAAYADPEMPFRVTTVQGQVVWYAEALEQAGIGTVADARERTLAIRTDDGRLIPLIETLRAHAFRVDQRLREMRVELVVRQYDRTPAFSVLKIFQLEDGQKYRIDYWCDVCAIVMYESGPCSCCQDDNRLRRTPISKANDAPADSTSATTLP